MAQLSNAYIEAKRNLNIFGGEKKATMRLTTGADGSMVLVADEDEDQGISAGAVAWYEGYNHWLSVLGSHDETKDKLPMVVMWRFKVSSTPHATAANKIIYMMNFLFKHRSNLADIDWCREYDTDASLRLFLIPPQGMQSTQPQKRKRRDLGQKSRERTPSNVGGRDSGRRADDRSSRNEARRERIPQSGEDREPSKKRRQQEDRSNNNKSLQRCFSRSDTSLTSCRAEDNDRDCRFAHDCASCGKDHLASACPNWSDNNLRTASRAR